MTRIFSIWFAFLCLAMGSPASAEALSLDELIAMAIENHPELLAADADVDVARADQSAVEGVYIPQFRLGGTLTGAPLMEGDPLQGRVHPRLAGLYFHLRVEGVMPLYASGQLSALRDASAAGVDVARAQRRVVGDEVTFQVNRAVLVYRRAISLERRFREIEDILESVRPEILAKEEGTKLDGALVLDVLLAETATRRIDAQRSAEAAKALMCLAIGEGVGCDIELDDEVIQSTFPVLLDLDACLELASKNRPDLDATRAGLSALEGDARYRERLFGPRVGLVGNYRISVAPLAEDQTGVFRQDPYNSNSGGAALGLEWKGNPVTLWADVEASQARVELLRGLVAFLRGRVDADVRLGYRRLVLAREVDAAQVKSLEASQQWFEDALGRFRRGHLSSRRFREAVLQYLQRSERAVFATYEHSHAVARLRQQISGAPFWAPENQYSTPKATD
jgi:outer membrane protein TolC